MDRDQSNNIFVGFLIGFFFVLGLMWLLKDNRSPDWWCFDSPNPPYCSHLYDAAVKKMRSMPQQDQPCDPDSMGRGGCS